MIGERLVVEVDADLKHAIQIKAAQKNVSIRDIVEPILAKAFKKEVQALERARV